jgi:hypothetical protein
MKYQTNNTASKPSDRRDINIPKEQRAETQQEVEKLKGIYEKLYFAHAYPKDAVKLLTRSCESIETHLLKKGFPKHRVETIFTQSLETAHKKV